MDKPFRCNAVAARCFLDTVNYLAIRNTKAAEKTMQAALITQYPAEHAEMLIALGKSFNATSPYKPLSQKMAHSR